MKLKSKISKDDLLADGTVHYGYDTKGNLWEHGKLVKATANAKPTEPKAADVVVRPEPKINVAPRLTDPPRRKLPEATGLQRAINANLVAQGKAPVYLPTKDGKPVVEKEVTGLQRSINHAIAEAAQKKN